MRRERVVEGEVRSAIRDQGIADIEHVQAVVLETDGTFTVLRSDASGGSSSLDDVKHLEEYILDKPGLT